MILRHPALCHSINPVESCSCKPETMELRKDDLSDACKLGFNSMDWRGGAMERKHDRYLGS